MSYGSNVSSKVRPLAPQVYRRPRTALPTISEGTYCLRSIAGSDDIRKTALLLMAFCRSNLIGFVLGKVDGDRSVRYPWQVPTVIRSRAWDGNVSTARFNSVRRTNSVAQLHSRFSQATISCDAGWLLRSPSLFFYLSVVLSITEADHVCRPPRASRGVHNRTQARKSVVRIFHLSGYHVMEYARLEIQYFLIYFRNSEGGGIRPVGGTVFSDIVEEFETATAER